MYNFNKNCVCGKSSKFPQTQSIRSVLIRNFMPRPWQANRLHDYIIYMYVCLISKYHPEDCTPYLNTTEVKYDTTESVTKLASVVRITAAVAYSSSELFVRARIGAIARDGSAIITAVVVANS